MTAPLSLPPPAAPDAIQSNNNLDKIYDLWAAAHFVSGNQSISSNANTYTRARADFLNFVSSGRVLKSFAKELGEVRILFYF